MHHGRLLFAGRDQDHQRVAPTREIAELSAPDMRNGCPRYVRLGQPAGKMSARSRILAEGLETFVRSLVHGVQPQRFHKHLPGVGAPTQQEHRSAKDFEH